MRHLIFAALIATVVGCTTTQVHQNPGVAYGATQASSVAILYSYPARPYTVIGVVSAKRYKPGWTDPTVNDAIPGLRAAGAQVGADAVVVHQSRSQNTRVTTIEGEAIRYTDRNDAPRPSTAPPASAADCVSCKKIGGG